jgi:hypothetical protein
MVSSNISFGDVFERHEFRDARVDEQHVDTPSNERSNLRPSPRVMSATRETSVRNSQHAGAEFVLRLPSAWLRFVR